jgi:hypothetical protein
VSPWLALAIIVVVLAWIRWRVGFWPWRQGIAWAAQVWCFVVRGHRWAEREVDLNHTVLGFRRPYLWICGACGAAAMREWDE